MHSDNYPADTHALTDTLLEKFREGVLEGLNSKPNQMVLRGASVATPAGHSRKTYRNFFNASHQWQFTGIRLAE